MFTRRKLLLALMGYLQACRGRYHGPPGSGGGGGGGDTTAPSVPGTPTVTALGSSSLQISWAASTDNVGVVRYRLQRRLGISGPFTDISTPSAISITDIGLGPATTYQYQVRAEDAAGNASAYSAIGTGTTLAIGATRQAANILGTDYYTPQKAFINYIWNSGSPWIDSGGAYPSAYVDAWGWPAGMPAGSTLFKYICWDTDAYWGYFPPGDYKIVSPSTITPGIESSSRVNVTNYVSAAGLCTFTIPNSALATTRMRLTITNNTGGALSPAVNSVKMYDVTHQALVDAGEIFHPAFLANLQGAWVLRTIDICGINNNVYPWLSSTDIVPYANYQGGYKTPRGFNTSTWPPELVGKLAKKLNTGIWWNAPPTVEGEDRLIQYRTVAATDLFTTYQTHIPGANYYNWVSVAPPVVNGDVLFMKYDVTPVALFNPALPIGPYYVINRNATDFQLSLTPGGAAVDVTVTLDGNDTNVSWLQGYYKYYDQLPVMRAAMARLYAEYPTCPEIHTEYANENWNFGLYKTFGYCRDVGTWVANGSVGTNVAAIGHAYYNLQAWKVTEEYYPRNVCKRTYAGQLWPGSLQAGLDFTDPSFVSAGQPVYNILDEVAVAPYHVPCHGTLGIYGDYPAWSFAEMMAANAHTWNSAQWRAELANNLLNMDIYIGQWRTLLNSKRAGVPLTTYEMGQGWFFSPPPPYSVGTQAHNLHLAFITHWFGPTGSSSRSDYKARVFDTWQLDLANHLGAGGEWYTGYQQFSWGREWYYGAGSDLLTWHKTQFISRP